MIVGAGLAGLIAANAFPKERIVEKSPQPSASHKALLRFRSTAVSELIGIPFTTVLVRKGIVFKGAFSKPNIRLSNLYSRKVIGRVLDRSIWNLEPATRYIAPENIYERLIESAFNRIEWNSNFDFTIKDEPIISTAPMHISLSALGISYDDNFMSAAITVERFRIKGADVYQTVYFPSSEHSLYRASITGSLLICEFIGEPSGRWLADIEYAFGLDREPLKALPVGHQRFGKIAEINEEHRKAYVVRLTQEHGIFSLGRFATWRNILLDDVVQDIAVIKRLITADEYERKIISCQIRT